MSENIITMAELPDNFIHLGGSEFLVVRSFQGHTRVHVRKFIENEYKLLLPTKGGVSLCPRVWVALTEKLPKLLSKRYFQRYPNDFVEVVERDLCVVKDTITSPVERIEITLQRLFQRRDKTLQFVPETVRLDEQQCYVLLSSSQRVKDLIEVTILTITLRHHVVKLVLQQASSEAQAYVPHPYNIGLSETMDSLCKCFHEFISLKIKELAPCYGCNEVPCSCHTKEELLNMYFESALYALNYAELAQQFIVENMHYIYFVNLILTRDFFTNINVSSFLNDVKNMYAPSAEMLCDALEIC